MKKKNKYKLDKESAAIAKDIVLESAVVYNIKDDTMRSIVAIRKDAANSDEFMLRVAQQLEQSLREVIAPYNQEIALVERLAKMGANVAVTPDECECAKSS